MSKIGPSRPPPKLLRPLLHLPEADWPEADRQRFAEAFAQPLDVFADDTGGNHLKPRTKTAIHYAYRRWLGWIAAYKPELQDSPPESRITPVTIRAHVAALRETCTPRTIATHIGKLHDAIRYMHPAQDWAWLKQIKARLERAIPRTGGKPILMTSRELVDANLKRLDEVDQAHALCTSTATRKHLQNLALAYRDALLVAFDAFLPLRRSNLSELEIGVTLSHGPNGWSVHIPEAQVKNGEPIMADLPDWIGERIDRFLEVYRPLIHRSASHKGLWASAKGQPATGDALYHAFRKQAARLCGHRLTLHDTRRIGATTWVLHNPVNAAGAKDLLGDRSDRVFAQHYNLASGIQASRAMAKLLAELKVKPK